MKRYILVNILLILSVSYIRTVHSNEISASALSSQEVENSELRKGFQFVYSIANSFIDIININFPEDLFSSINGSNIISSNELEDKFLNYFNTADWKGYFNKVTK